MRIRLNTKTDELWIELEGSGGDRFASATDFKIARSIEIPGENGRAAVIEIDQNGYVRMIRVARLAEVIAEFSPAAAKAAKSKGKGT